jgi:hypothetical protein
MDGKAASEKENKKKKTDRRPAKKEKTKNATICPNVAFLKFWVEMYHKFTPL